MHHAPHISRAVSQAASIRDRALMFMRGNWPMLVAIAYGLFVLLLPDVAMAGPFDVVGDRLKKVVCEFVKSPLVLVIVAAALIGLLVLMAVNEDKGLISTALKILVGGLMIYFLGSFIVVLGIGDLGCS